MGFVMGNVNFKYEVVCFEEFLRDNKSVLMDSEDMSIDSMKKLQGLKSFKYKGKKIDEDKLTINFLKCIDVLGKETVKFYKSNASNIPICRDNSFDNGEAVIIGNGFHQQIIMTSEDLTEEDFMAYTHELGHLPQMRKPFKDEYFEYIETFPMFLEYLASLSLGGKKNGDLFLKVRLEICKEMAKAYLRYCKDIKDDGSYKDKFLFYQKREILKYMKSLDYALQLIDRFSEDPKMTKRELDRYVSYEKSMRDIGRSLDINTKNCKKLMKSITKK
jgi:DNA-binding CsgD family transcriptional regulator